MKIAVYYPWIYLHGGVERSLLELVSRSRHDWTIFTGRFDATRTFPGFARHRVVELERISVERSIPKVLGAALTIVRHKIPLDEADAFVVWCDGLGDLATIRNRRRPTFNICSTPLRAVFDPVYAREARAARGCLGRMAYRVFEAGFRGVDRRVWRNYDGVIATSREVMRRILDGGLYPEGPRMRLLHPGIDTRAAEGEVSYRPILLVPGRIMWTKNIELAIEAFLRAELPAPWQLVIAGFAHERSADYLRRLRALAADDPRVVFIPSPSDEELRSLYRASAAVLFPPLNEDWGIVPLEAMAHGKPVLANAAGGPLESVLHGQTGWLLAPNVEDWAQALRGLVGREPLLREMGARARAHVARYDWSRFVGGVDDAIEAWTEQAAQSP